MSRMSSSQKSWTGVMIEDPRFVGPSLARRRASSSAPFANRRGDRDGAARGGDIVRADHRGALEDRDRRRSQAGLEPLVDRKIEDLSEEALARDADHDRATERRDLVEAR